MQTIVDTHADVVMNHLRGSQSVFLPEAPVNLEEHGLFAYRIGDGTIYARNLDLVFEYPIFPEGKPDDFDFEWTIHQMGRALYC